MMLFSIAQRMHLKCFCLIFLNYIIRNLIHSILRINSICEREYFAQWLECNNWSYMKVDFPELSQDKIRPYKKKKKKIN